MIDAATAAPIAGEAVETGRPRNVWPIMSCVLLVMLLASLDQTIVATAMPRVIAHLNGFDRYAWVATAYLLFSTISVPIYGKLSDLFGRKAILMWGIVVFLLGSGLCGAAQTMTQLIVFRGLQGLGGGALAPMAVAVVGDLFPPKERGKWQGLTGSVFAFAAMIGPTLGGWITDTFSWRWIFYVNLPVGLVALSVLLAVMPPLRARRAAGRIDALGATLLVLGVSPLLLAVTWAGGAYAWNSPRVLGVAALGVAVLIFFVRAEWRHREPILEPRLFANRIFSISVAATLLIGAGMLGAIYFVPLFVQAVAGASATGSGAILTPLMLAAIAGSISAGQLMSRWGRYRYIALFGLGLMMAGMGLLLRLGVQTRPPEVLPALLVLGAGLGFGLSLYNIVVQNAFPRERLGQVSSTLIFFRSIGGALGIAAMGALLTARFRAGMPASLGAGVPIQNIAALHNPRLLLEAQGRDVLAQTLSRLGPEGSHLYNLALKATRLALADALHAVFLSGLFIAVAAFCVVLFLPEIPLRGRDKGAD